VRTDFKDGTSQGQIRYVVRVELIRRQRQSGVDAVRPLVRADGVPLRRVPDGADDGTTNARVGMAPADGDRVYPERIRVRSECDVIRFRNLRNRDAVGVLWGNKVNS